MQQQEPYYGTDQTGQPPDVPALRRALVAAGFTPLPLFGKSPPAYGKNGAKKGLAGWQNLDGPTLEQIEAWSRDWPDAINTGILTRHTPALDLDILGEEAARACEDLVRARFEEHGAVLVRIGMAPKRAILFRAEVPFAKILINVTAGNGTAEKIEFLGDGQQLVVDGVHPETKAPYRWHGGEPGQIRREDLPSITADEAQALIEDLTELLVKEFGYTLPTRRKSDGGARNPGGSDWVDLFDNIREGRALHDSLRDLAAKLIKSGTNPGAAVNQLRATLAGSSTPRDERFRKRWQEIPRLVDSAIAKFAPAAPPDSPPPQPSPNAGELSSMTFPPIKYVVPGIIVEGLTLLAGKPKVGKSWLLLHAAIAVARKDGGFTLGEIHCIEGDVLYCALEDNLRRLQSRMLKLLGVTQSWPERLRFRCEMPRLTEGGLDVIKEWISSVTHPRLIIIDTLAMVRAPTKQKEQTQYDADYAAVLELRTLANEHGLAVVVVHHLRKMAADDPFDTISGTLGLSGAPDSTLVLKHDSGGSGTIVLHGRGRDLPEIEKALVFNRDSCTWRIAGELPDVRSSDARKAVLSAMQEIDAPASAREIAAYTRLKTVNVQRMLQRLVSDGAVKRLQRGKYQLVAKVGAEELQRLEG